MIIPAMTGATGIETKFKENLETVPGRYSIVSLQQTAIIGTPLRRVLQSESRELSGAAHRCFRRSTRKKRPVTTDNNNNNIIIITSLSPSSSPSDTESRNCADYTCVKKAFNKTAYF
jgi:hypothetical protein